MTRPSDELTPPADLRYRGWFHLGTARALRRRRVTTMRRFGGEVVVRADGRGRLHALGPAGADVPVTEVGGFAFMYRRAPGDDGPPPPIHPELAEALRSSGRCVTSFPITVATTLADYIENGVDWAHIPVVHPGHVGAVSPVAVDRHHDGTLSVRASLSISAGRRNPVESTTQIDYFDAANTRARNHLGPGVDIDLVALAAPKEPRLIDLRFVVVTPKRAPVFDQIYNLGARYSFWQAVRQDRTVLETRTFIDPPILSDADGPILELRRWHAHFREPIE